MGGAGTIVGTWVDTIITSTDGDPTHGTVLAQVTHTGALAAGEFYNQTKTISLPPSYQTHSHLFVRTDAGDAVFENSIEADNYAEASTLFDVTPTPYADLVVSSLSAPSTADSSKSMQVSWTVTNQSPHAIATTNSTEWSDQVSLASDPAGKNIVRTLGSFDHVGALAVGDSYARSGSVLIPDGMSGTFYVVVHTSGPSEFIYTDNNIAVSGPLTITLSPAPDLKPTSIVTTTPGSTQELTSANAGDKIDVTWTIQNADTLGGQATGTWYDSIHLQEVGGTHRDYTLGVFDYATPLDAGKSYTRTELVQLPSNVEGVFQLVVHTNAGFFPIFENGRSTNNVLADPQTLTLVVPPNPDLQVFSIDNAPATADAGGTVALDFTIINQADPEARGHWTDNVYISLKDHLDGSAILLGSFDNKSALMQGEKYQTSTPPLLVPKRLGGPAYLIVATNANGAVNEFPHPPNNTFVRSIFINPEPPADLVTGTVVAPDQAHDGDKITVSYTVTNKGLEPTDQTSWLDQIWLTRDKTRPNVSKGDVLLATIPHTGVLGDDPSVIAPPTSYNVTATVTLPKHISGQFYITPWSDSFDVVHKSTLLGRGNDGQVDRGERRRGSVVRHPLLARQGLFLPVRHVRGRSSHARRGLCSQQRSAAGRWRELRKLGDLQAAQGDRRDRRPPTTVLRLCDRRF